MTQDNTKLSMCYIDFEYRKSSEPKMELVAVTMLCTEQKEVVSHDTYWVPGNAEDLAGKMRAMKDSHIFLGFSISSAECRCFSALGLDPTEFKWIDMRSEYRQIQCGNNARKYGKYLSKDGVEVVTFPPKRGKYGAKGAGGDDSHKHIDANLVNMVYAFTGINLGRDHKKEMISLILRGGEYTQQEKDAILEYCASDVVHLPLVMRRLLHEWKSLSGGSFQTYLTEALYRGEWSARLSLATDVGIPVNVPRLVRLGQAAPHVVNALAALVNEKLPAYRWDEKQKRYIECQKTFDETITRMGLASTWRRTDPTKTNPEGSLSRSKETLEAYDGVPEFDTYRRAKNIMHHLTYLKQDPNKDAKKAEEKWNIYSKIGSDDRLRVFFNPYGGKTSRNQPAASNFILAMASMFRCCIEPPPGFVVITSDWSAQEFLIAACISGDENMVAAYKGKDPYLWMAKQVGALPPDATKETPGAKPIREMFKIVTLGLQFGIGEAKLVTNLSLKLKRDVTRVEVKKVMMAHKTLFRDFWSWVDDNLRTYSRDKALALPDGWRMFGDEPNALSVGNFPVQGGGATVLRRAVKYCQQAGLQVCATLHDAIYVLHPEAEEAEGRRVLQECMERSFKELYGGDIRMGIKSIRHGQFWIEEKGAPYFKQLKNYFLTPEELDTCQIMYGDMDGNDWY